MKEKRKQNKKRDKSIGSALRYNGEGRTRLCSQTFIKSLPSRAHLSFYTLFLLVVVFRHRSCNRFRIALIK